ncbi:hypothetical protein [Oceanivirga miroungae]|uniref:Phage SPO1 DNA polymerase-like protein n=1 Tax=Oceanivirga miroungae TaxID=1130046 RepID=A0A6I8M9D1_9FUSO|nr:hypothetical protein [Oceanivirga miroungae]VWL85415.1 phage SPO1 DNA polymerase-like protein [Oceanivirga miroungae]
MWEELEKEIKLYDECNYLNLDVEPILGVGNKKAKFFVLFDSVTDSMNENKDVEKSKEYEKLKVIFNFCEIDLNNCYFTCLDKYYSKNEKIDFEKRKYAMSILLKELFIVKPEYVITIGENILNYIYYYLTDRKDKIDILKSVGKIFDINNMKFVPIYDIEHIGKLDKKKKKELVEILKEINK